MKTKIYLKPLRKHLSEQITPKQLSRLLDELAYDYARMTMCLQQTENDLELHYHPEACDFLYHLKMLRDVLRRM